MAKEILLSINEDGIAKIYDDTYDITIHCEDEEEKQFTINRLNDVKWNKLKTEMLKQDNVEVLKLMNELEEEEKISEK